MKFKTVCILSALVLLAPFSTSAFVTEDGKTLQVTEDTWLNVNTASFGSAEEEVRIPIATAPSWVSRISGNYLRYQLLLGEQVFAGLDTTALVLSTAPIVGNEYVVPAGETYEFTLVTFLTIESDDFADTTEGEEVSMSIEVTSY